MGLRSRLLGCGLVAVATVSIGMPQMASAKPNRTVPLLPTAPPLPEGTIDDGPSPLGAQVALDVLLSINNRAGAAALARAVSDPSSRSYGRYLSPQQYRSAFAPNSAQFRHVRDWATSHGLDAGDSPKNNGWIPLTGTVGQADRTFGVVLHDYRIPDGTDDDGNPLYLPLRQPAQPARIPSDLADRVVGILGLSTDVPLRQPNHVRGDSVDKRKATIAPAEAAAPTATSSAPPPDAFVNAQPCSAFWNQKQATTDPGAFGIAALPYAPCGYTPAQLAGAYGVAGVAAHGITAAGVTVAITDAYNAPTILSDANTYATKHGQAPFAQGQFREIKPAGYRLGYDDTTANGDVCGEQGWYGEETLDVEAVHAMAPGANVLYVGGASCEDSDLLAAITTVLDGHLADIITNSWGDLGEPDPVYGTDILAVYGQTFLQAAIEGIGVFFSSGDDGDDSIDFGTPAVDYPASDPWVTSVGGTSLGVGADNQYLFETGWGTGKSTLTSGAWAPAPPGAFLYGGGGGISSDFDAPWYQRGVVPNSLSHHDRVVPDLALVGDPSTGMLVGETQTFPDGSVSYSEYRIGGTSLSSPLMAGIEALADQAAGHAHGFANPTVYANSGTSAFRDITQPAKQLGVVRVDFVNGVNADDGTVDSLRSFNQTLSLEARPRYDNVTGVGSPKGAAYVFGV
jgi:subtilase family serine protease